MAKSTNKDGVRQRKKNENGGSTGSGDGEAKQSSKTPFTTKSQPPTPSSAGMTCLNWFVVLFFIFAASGGASFLIYNEMTVTNRVIVQELERLRSETSDLVEFKGQIRQINSRLSEIARLKEDFVSLHDEGALRSTSIKELSAQMKRSREGVMEISAQFEESTTKFENLQAEIEALKSVKSSDTESDETATSIKRLDELISVSNTNVAYLSEEVIRIDKRLREYFEQSNSIQKEVIDLTADKLAMSAAIESIKSTVVSVRDNIEKMQSQTPSSTSDGDSGSLAAKVEELDTRTTAEIAQISRQVSETSENSAQWLQQSTDQIGKKFQQQVEDLKKQFNEVKVQLKEPAEASDNESLINSVATLDKKLKDISNKISKLDRTVMEVASYQESRKQADKDEDDSIAKLTYQVMEVVADGRTNGEIIKQLTERVNSVSNEMNGVQSITRILESRLDEIRTGKKDPIPQPAEPEGQKE